MKKIQFTDLILFENDRVMVVNKPPMLSSLDERFADAPSLLRMAKAHDPELRLCHRLDKETSGALILAKTTSRIASFRWNLSTVAFSKSTMQW